MGDIRYYIAEHADEIMPCDCTLRGWRDYLLEGNPEESKPAGVRDGDVFSASAIEYQQVSVSRLPDGTYSKPVVPEGFRLHAIRYGDQLGWAADDIIYDEEDFAQLISEETDAVLFLAVMRQLPDVQLRLAADSPEMLVEAVT